MNLKVFMIGSLLLSFAITGCARNNVNNENVAYRNQNGMQPTRVDYTNRPGVRDVNDTNLNRTDLRNNGTVTDVRNNDGKSRMRVADQAANKVADMREVDSANVIATENNAYVAVKLANGANLTNSLEQRISNKVKSVDRDIDRVYISANPDFFKQMRDYAGDIRNGRPITGFFTEFTQSIQRVFPDVK